jgi:energy-coupling factor transporter ATP-binding protein EcfA2
VALTIEFDSFHYPGGRTLLGPTRLQLQAGQKVALLGGSGSGKTSLVGLLAGLHPSPLGGRAILRPEGGDWPTQESVGYLGSDPSIFLTGFCTTVMEEVGWTLFGWGWDAEKVEQRVSQALGELGLSELAWRDPAALSGGQQQLVALAAVWACQPRYLLLDEPVSKLDPRARESLQEVVAALAEQQNVGVLWATSNLGEVRWCDQLWLLRDGAVEVLPSDWQPGEAELILLPWSVEWSRRWGNPAPDWRAELPQGQGGLPDPPPVGPFRLADGLPQREANQSDQPAIVVEGLRYTPAGHPGELFEDFSWYVQAGECVGLIGPNGAGKTTLAMLVRGLLPPTAGSIRLAGREVVGRPVPALASTVAYTFQDPGNLFVRARVDEELLYSGELLGLSEAEARSRAEQALRVFGLSRFADHHPRELPASQAALLGVALSWFTLAPLQILDEPLARLDRSGRQLLESVLAAWREQGTTVVVIAHDLDWLACHCTSFTVLESGETLARGPAGAVFCDPRVQTRLGVPLPLRAAQS